MLSALARMVHQRPLRCGIHVEPFFCSSTLQARRCGAKVSTRSALASTSRSGSDLVSPPPADSRKAGYDPVELAYDLIEPVELRWSDQSMVICHGLFGSKANWRGQARRLANLLGIPVYILDMRNHGRSPHAAPHTSQAMAHDVAAFLARKSVMSGVHLVGHSMGAKMAMTLALNHRLNLALRSLTVVDMAPTNEPIEPQYTDYARGMMEIEATKVATMREADTILQKYESAAATRRFLLTNAVYVRDPSGEGPPHIRFRCALPILAEAIATLGDFPYEHNNDDVLAAPSARWDGPTLFLRGGKSDYLTPRNIPATQHFFPRSKVVTIPHAGHWVHADAPEETTRDISSFVRDALG